jgi:hypothetical protein
LVETLHPHRFGGKRSRISSSSDAAAAVCLIFDAIMFCQRVQAGEIEMVKTCTWSQE